MKLMEVIEKTIDPQKGTAKLRLLETGFQELGKVLGDDPIPPIWEEVLPTDKKVYSVQFIQILNGDQLEYIPELNNFKTQYNNWVDTISSNIGLENFTYNFNSLKDYSAGYIPEITTAGYRGVLTDITACEVEMFDFTYKSDQSMVRNQNHFKNWSKNKPYGSCVDKMKSAEFEMREIIYWTARGITSDVPGITAIWLDTSSSGTDKNRMLVEGLENLSLGETVKFFWWDEDVSSYETHWQVKRTELGVIVDDGVTDSFAIWGSGNGFHRINGTHSYQAYTGNHSTHFDNQQPDLPWLKSRVLL